MYENSGFLVVTWTNTEVENSPENSRRKILEPKFLQNFLEQKILAKYFWRKILEPQNFPNKGPRAKNCYKKFHKISRKIEKMFVSEAEKFYGKVSFVHSEYIFWIRHCHELIFDLSEVIFSTADFFDFWQVQTDPYGPYGFH